MRLSLLIFTIFLSLSLYAQGVVSIGGCNSLTTQSVPSYATNIYISTDDDGPHFISSTNDACKRLVGNPGTAIRPLFHLEQKGSTGNWFRRFDIPSQYTGNFTNLSQGTYRVAVRMPLSIITSGCGGLYQNQIDVLNSAAQPVGVLGFYDQAFLLGNEVLVGSTTSSDINAQITDASGTPTTNFEVDDPVFLDLSQSTNYNRYLINISIVDGPAYQSSGWQLGATNSVNLNDIWSNNGSNGWAFWADNSFEILVALENKDCPNSPWVVKTYTFQTAPPCVPTATSDIDAQITDASGTPMVNFEVDDPVFLDLSQSTNYDRYLVNISLIGGPAWQTSNWQVGTAGSINLNNIWSNNGSNGWAFWTANSFEVLVAMENQDCPSSPWVVKTYIFDTCPGGTGTCRFVENTQVSIFPNPAIDRVTVRNIDIESSVNHMVTISSIDGQMLSRERLTGLFIDVSSLNPGVYVIRIDDENENLITTKLFKQ